MPLKIGYLAWGSLIWDYKSIPVKAPWQKTSLRLPLEFSRISDKGKGRLTLVIDEVNGEENHVWHTEADTSNITTAINKLKLREKTISHYIAYVNLKKNKERVINTPDKYVDRIKKWAKRNFYDVIIWTDLPQNWEHVRGKKYNKADALDYFKKSQLRHKLLIFDYFLKSSKLGEIKTPFLRYFTVNMGKYIID